MQQSLRAGVIGLGMAGQHTLATIAENPKVTVAAFSDTNEEILLKVRRIHPEAIAHTSWEGVVKNPDVDIVYVILPHHLHFPVIKKALANGKHVFSEKPLSMNVAEAVELKKLSERMGKEIFLGFNMIFSPAAQTVKKIVAEGRLGDIFMTSFDYFGYEVARMNDPNNWKGTFDKAGGGVLLDGGYHMVYLANYITGAPKTVQAITKRLVVKTENKAEDNAIVVCEYENGAMGKITASFSVLNPGSLQEPTLETGFSVFGTKGSVSGGYRSWLGKDWGRLVEGDKESELRLDPSCGIAMHDYYIDCLLKGEKPFVIIDDACYAQAVVEAAYISSKTGEKVNVAGLLE